MSAILDIDRVKDLIKVKDLSYSDLAEQISVDRSTISSWFSGRTNPTPENLEKLAKSLDIEMEELITHEHQGVVVKSPNNQINVNHRHFTFNIHANNFILPADAEEMLKIIEQLTKSEKSSEELEE